MTGPSGPSSSTGPAPFLQTLRSNLSNRRGQGIMDPLLVEYLNSGEAWVFVGSGPSIEVDLPSWGQLAEAAVRVCQSEGSAKGAQRADELRAAANYPQVFERVAADIGLPRLLDVLRPMLGAGGRRGATYRAIARWPVRNYLTTNFDDEIQRHLAFDGESFQVVGNSPDHLALLHAESSGFIAKIHGDLKSPDGLVLTSSQYNALATSAEWRYWRDRLAAIFGMCRVVVVGYSLSDTHVRAVLEAAKVGSSVARPVSGAAPEVTEATPEGVPGAVQDPGGCLSRRTI